MEIIAVLLVPFAALAFLTLLAIGAAQGHGRSESEDRAQYEHFNPPAREVDGKAPTPVQTADTSETVGKSSDKAATSSQTTYVRSVIQRQPCWCFEHQSVDEALKIMRERDVRYLLVLDNNERIVGIATIEDLMRAKKQDAPAPDPE